MVCGGIVAITWMFAPLVRVNFYGVQSWWLIIRIVFVCVFSLAAIRAQ